MIIATIMIIMIILPSLRGGERAGAPHPRTNPLPLRPKARRGSRARRGAINDSNTTHTPTTTTTTTNNSDNTNNNGNTNHNTNYDNNKHNNNNNDNNSRGKGGTLSAAAGRVERERSAAGTSQFRSRADAGDVKTWLE